MNGAIFKYYPRKESDDYLFDSGTVPDPDFCSNISDGMRLPVWSICGVYHRRDIEPEGGMIFFVPARKRWAVTELDDYYCTGVLVTGSKIDTMDHFLRDSRFTQKYLEGYRLELTHPDDTEITRRLRMQNIIVGNPIKSVWFGRNNVRLRPLLEELGLRQSQELDRINRAISRLSNEESKKLYDQLVTRIGRRPCPMDGGQPPGIPKASAVRDCSCTEDENC